MAHSEAIRPRDDASWLGQVVLGRVRTLPLPQDALRTSLVILLLLAPQLACIEFDVAWHNSPLRKFPFLGLPHPWTLEHLGIVLPVPLTFLLLARLQAPQSAQTGLKMLRFRGVSRPTGAFVSLAGWLLLGFGLLFDGAWHALSGQRAEGGVVAFPHLVIQFAGVVALFGSMLLLYDLATGPALGDNQSQRLLARGALLLSLVWLVQSLAMIFPFTPHAYGPHTEAAWTTITLSVGLLVALQFWTAPFPALSVLTLLVVFRAAVYGLLVKNSYADGPLPLEPVLVAGLAVDLWLLLPFNRARGTLALLVAGAVFAVIWAPMAYYYFMAVANPARTSVLKLFLFCIPAAAAGTLVGFYVGRSVKRFYHPTAPERAAPAVAAAAR